MTLYRITRYGRHGNVKWVKYKTTKHSFSAAKGEINSGFMGARHDRVTVEAVRVRDIDWEMEGDFSIDHRPSK